MMIRGSSSLKEVGDSQDSKNNNDHDEKKKKKSSASGSGSGSTIGSNKCCSSSSWHRLKDPRIVRVSRGFGGKDRHSKVCTVRGLRDRRVRLSVPTAIQLYDLQDRLGLSQPSKVVDWLLNAAKDEIDELPPLQIPPLGFPTKYQQHDHNKEQAAVESSSLYQWDPNNSFPMHMHMQPSTWSLSSSNYFPLLETHNNVVNVIDPTLHLQMLHHHTSSIRPDFQLPSQIKDQQHHFPPLSKYPPTSTN